MPETGIEFELLGGKAACFPTKLPLLNIDSRIIQAYYHSFLKEIYKFQVYQTPCCLITFITLFFFHQFSV